MKIRNVWAVYFSATGTTKKVVTFVAKTLSEKLAASYQAFSFNLPQNRNQQLTFGADDLVVFGVPVYAGRVPNVLLPFIRDKVSGDNTLSIPLVMYGNRNYDDSLIELFNVMQDNGFCPIAAGAFVGEHSFSHTLGAGRPDSEDMALAQELAQKAAERVLLLKGTPTESITVPGSNPIRPYFTPQDRNGDPIKGFLKAKPKTDPDKCVDCGLCARICPMGAIDPNDISNVIGTCIKCCACVKKCPKDAKYFDHEGFLYHQHELEDVYGTRRAPSLLFY